MLTETLQGTGFEGAAQACSWAWAQTGNFFLDSCYDDGNYDGFADPWEDEIIQEGTEEWRKASALMDSVMRLAGWLEEDLPGPLLRDAGLHPGAATRTTQGETRR